MTADATAWSLAAFLRTTAAGAREGRLRGIAPEAMGHWFDQVADEAAALEAEVTALTDEVAALRAWADIVQTLTKEP